MINNIMTFHESHNTEFELSWHDDYLKWICGLANACFLGGYIDAWGRGTLKIINACKDVGLPEPEIVEKNGGVSTTLFVQSPESNVEKGSEKTSEKIIKAILLNPQITIAELANLTGVTTRSVERNIGSLRKAGRLTRNGPDKGGHWEVIVD